MRHTHFPPPPSPPLNNVFDIAAGSIIMASDKMNQCLVTADVDGFVKVWSILEYATLHVDEPITDLPREYSICSVRDAKEGVETDDFSSPGSTFRADSALLAE